eukprot:TRINITY_DN6484_c0_g3_i1.p1 TRINITY_DN6484_c0_g3~~TRINITY_DN6484_c0_g3_i1.p1  ORF type:complete len:311 (+),score=113.75 TRINITY_DN6484_c0_g3_i1:51-935(+)
MAAVPASAPRSCFVFGAGMVGGRLARRLVDEGWAVAGTTVGRADAERLSAGGVPTWSFDGTAPLPPPARSALGKASHVISTAPPLPDGTDPVLRQHGADLTGKKWVGYISSSGVYGDAGGRWVDERAELRPATRTAARRLRCEAQWRALPDPAVVFRMAGLYGPGRSALTQLRRGTARRISKPGHVISRVHVDDVVDGIVRSMERPGAGKLFNLADATPAGQSEVVAEAARLLGVPAPEEQPYEAVAASMPPRFRDFYSARRRVSSALARGALGWRPRYDSYREGLRQCIGEEG